MLRWALVFFIISLIAGLLGFTGLASGAAAIAKVLFTISLVLFLMLLLGGLLLERKLENKL